MDLRAFYQKIREIEDTIDETFVVVVSNKTTDGGRDGVFTEVSRAQAARLVAEQRARLATAEEAKKFRAKLADSVRQAAEQQVASRLQLVISDADLRGLGDRIRPKKG